MNPGQKIQASNLKGMIRPHTDEEVKHFLSVCPGEKQGRDGFSVTWRHEGLILRIERDTGGRDTLSIGSVVRPNTFYLYEQVAFALGWIKREEILNYATEVEEYFSQDNIDDGPPDPPDCLNVMMALKTINRQAPELSCLFSKAELPGFASKIWTDWEKLQEQMWKPVVHHDTEKQISQADMTPSEFKPGMG